MDKVFVIYYDGQMYKNKHRKNAYLEEQYAKQVITQESKDLARQLAGEDGLYWYDIKENLQDKYLDKARNKFEIREFVERG